MNRPRCKHKCSCCKGRVKYIIGDIRDKDRLHRALNGIDTVIHCAAMKHVDICAENPFEAVQTNVIGAQNLIETCLNNGVKKCLAVSSDKAVNPINLYGATKLCADKLFLNASGRTKFSVIRFGNFWGSRGSVVPYFEQLKKDVSHLLAKAGRS